MKKRQCLSARTLLAWLTHCASEAYLVAELRWPPLRARALSESPLLFRATALNNATRCAVLRLNTLPIGHTNALNVPTDMSVGVMSIVKCKIFTVKAIAKGKSLLELWVTTFLPN